MNLIEAPEHHEVGILRPALAVAGLVVAGAVAYKKFHHEIDPRLLEASLLPYCEDIETEIMTRHDAVIVGGLPIDAFNHPGSVIDAFNQTITVSDDFDTPLIRADNGSVRDYDVMIIGRGEDGGFVRMPDEEQDQLKAKVTALAALRGRHDQLPVPEMSVFSFDSHSSLFHSATIVDENGGLVLEQGNVRQDLPDDSMTTWNLVLASGTKVKVLDPWEQYWRSMVRFSSGMKPKDAEKLEIMRNKLESIEPLARRSNSDLCWAYENFLRKMLEGNSPKAFADEIRAENRDPRELNRLGWLVVARFAMETGQKSKTIQRIVQSTPKVFNLFVGSK